MEYERPGPDKVLDSTSHGLIASLLLITQACVTCLVALHNDLFVVNSALTNRPFKGLTHHMTKLSYTTHYIYNTKSTQITCNSQQPPTMSDPSLYTYPSPLSGYEGLEPLPKYASFLHTTHPQPSSNTHPPAKKPPTENPTSTRPPPKKAQHTPPSPRPSQTGNAAASTYTFTSCKATTRR